jgi:hypothetical protein
MFPTPRRATTPVTAIINHANQRLVPKMRMSNMVMEILAITDTALENGVDIQAHMFVAVISVG